MRLQEVLRERETEISTLEESLRENHAAQVVSQVKGAAGAFGHPSAALDNVDLSPKTLNNFDHIKQSMVNGNGHTTHPDNVSNHSESDESLERLNELMLYVTSTFTLN